MTLLDPRALALLALIPLLVLLHLRRRRRAVRRVPFLALWRPGEAAARPRLRWRRPRRRSLLLALRVLFLVGLILALARPATTLRAFAPGRPVVFVFDSSASMGAIESGRSRFERARESSLAVLAGLARDDRVQLVQAASRPLAVTGFLADRRELRRRILALEPFDTGADLETALDLALSATGGGRKGHVYLFGDAAASALPAAAASRLTVLTVGAPAENLGITRLAPRPNRLSPWEHDLLVEVANHTSRRREVPLTVSAGERIVFEAVVPLAAGERRSVVAHGLSLAGAVVEARLSQAGASDALAADDRAWAVVAEPRPRRVLLVGTGSRFVDRALAAHPLLAVSRVAPEELTPGHGDPFDLVVVERPLAVRPGGRAVLAFAGPQRGDRRRIESLQVVETARDHPAIAWAGLAEATVAGAAGLSPAADERVLLTAGGRPVLTARESGGRRQLVVGLDPEDPIWTGSLSFPLFIANAVRWLLEAEEAGAPTLAAGEVFARDLPPGVEAASLRVRDPDGSLWPVAESVGRIVFERTWRAGVYSLTGPGLDARFAVNAASATESDLAPRPAAAASDRRPIAAPRAAGSAVELGRYALLLSLLVLAAERLVARSPA